MARSTHALSIAGAALVLTGLFLSRLYSYPLFHSIAELFSVVVAFGIFMVGWNTREFIENKYFLFLGIAYPFIGFLDGIHMLAYKGLEVFEGYDSNLPSQLWIASRAMESLSLFLAPFFVRRSLRLGPLVLAYACATGLSLGCIFQWGVFPECFRESSGLTPFKILAEYAIAMVLGASGALLYRNREDFDTDVIRLLLASIFVTIASEMSFTLFRDVYGGFNLVGHYLKIISFYLIYRAIIRTGLTKPYRMLHADLRRSQEKLQEAHAKLELRVSQRTAEAEAANELLRQEIRERGKAQEALRESEELYETLVEASLAGVYMAQDGKILFANERFAQIFGYTRKEVLGMETVKLVYPEDRPLFQRIQEKRQAGEAAPSEYEARGLTRDGRTIWVIRRISIISYGGRPAVLANVADITKRKRMEQELRFLSSRILSAEESERKRIAHEMHDGVGQLLGAIKFRIETIQLRMKNGPDNVNREGLQEVVSLIQRTIEEIRRILAALRPSILDDLGILPTINWLCREFQKTYAGVTIEKHIGVREQDVPDALKTVIFRVLQESFNNVAKHSRADRVQVSLNPSNGSLLLEIADNGIGFDPDRALALRESGGIGLQSIRERTRLSGGTFELRTGLRLGTHIRVSWPMAEEERESPSSSLQEGAFSQS
ncbi:MAG: MASE3 domain-containing protein [Desulfobacteraceae bacterium]